MSPTRLHRTSFPLFGFLLILAATQVQLQTPVKKCPGKADVVIVLDSSTSVGEDNWKLQLDFVKNLLEPLTIGPSADRVAFVTYNTEAKLEFNFDKHSTAADVKLAVSSTKFTEGVTATGDALELARERVLSTARKDATKIIYLVTDGMTNTGIDPKEEAKKIKATGATIITVGITDQINKDALKSISSSGEVAQVSDYNKLSTLLQSLSEKTCEAKVVTTVAPPVTTTIKVTPSPIKKCEKGSQAEVVIVLDSSTSVGDDNWKLQLDFVANLLKPLNVGPKGDRVGFVTYNTEAKVVFGLDKYNTLADVLAAVQSTKFTEGFTATGDALALAGTDVFSKARAGVPKTVFLVTDGRTNMGADPKVEAAKLKGQGVKIVTVGIGDVDEGALKLISSSGNVAKVDNFSQLTSLIQSVAKESCSAKR